MDFQELLDYCKAEAIANSLMNSELSVWRDLCRSYSITFSTPLHLCLDGTIQAEDIMLAVFENQLENFDPDKDLPNLLDQLYTLEDPNYQEERSKELEEFMVRAAEEERERIRLGKPIHKALKAEANLKNTSEKAVEEKPKKTGGFLNLAYLQREEMNQTGGFEE